MKKKKILYIALLAAFTISLCSSAHILAQYIDNETPFFSYKRFYAQLDMLTNTSDRADVRSDIRAFMRNLADGIRAISEGEPERARAKLLKALGIWPEYFGTYFLLARVSEDEGDYKLSAMFYKSYLNNLKAYSGGEYRVSGPLMKSMTPYNIEPHDEAYAAVRDRLKARGIDLAAVQPYYVMPNYFRTLMIVVIFGAGCAIAFYVIIPYLKRWRHMHNPPEGSWVCGRCAAYNLNIMIECEKCGRNRYKDKA